MSIIILYLSLVGFMHAVSEERSEVGTTCGHNGTMYGEMSILHTNHGITQLTVLAQVIQYVTRLQHTATPSVYHHAWVCLSLSEK